jgi:hypothetical protein
VILGEKPAFVSTLELGVDQTREPIADPVSGRYFSNSTPASRTARSWFASILPEPTASMMRTPALARSDSAALNAAATSSDQ